VRIRSRLVAVVVACGVCVSVAWVSTAPPLGRSVLLQARTRTSGCTLGASPDRRCSPGAYYSGLTKRVICSPGFRTSMIGRLTAAEKHAVEREYGLAPKSYGRSLEIDRIVSLGLGGSNAIANLFPERADAHPGYRVKDRLESKLHHLVCSGAMTLRTARRGIASDWQRLYARVFGTAPTDTAAGPPSQGPCGTKVGRQPATYAHVVWVVMENHSSSQVVGSGSAPFLTRLASECGLATDYAAITHPSLPNYIAMTSGSTQGITDDDPPSSHPLSAPSIFSQLGTGWRSLQESMPSNCLLSNSGDYAVKHNPAAYYTGIRSACARQDVPLGPTPDLSAAFTFVTPNTCSDMHDCSVSTGDAWLATFIGKVFSTPEWTSGNTALFVTWDEDDGSSGNHVATLVLSPYTPAGQTSSTGFTHYSLLHTTELMLGLPCLANACSAPSMRTAFGL
jgi:hypothetical protein